MHEPKASALSAIEIVIDLPELRVAFAFLCSTKCVLSDTKCALSDLMHRQVTRFERSDWLEDT